MWTLGPWILLPIPACCCYGSCHWYFHRFLGQILVTPRNGSNPTNRRFRLEFRGWFQTIADRPDAVEQNLEFPYLFPDGTILNNAYFGIEDIQVSHRVPGTVLRAPTGGFTRSVLGLGFQIIAPLRWIREQAIPPATWEPSTAPMTTSPPGGGS